MRKSFKGIVDYIGEADVEKNPEYKVAIGKSSNKKSLLDMDVDGENAPS